MGLQGPSFPTPLVTPDDLKRLTPNPDVDQELGYVFQAIALTKKSMDNKLPIFGFCGGPWTVMCGTCAVPVLCLCCACAVPVLCLCCAYAVHVL